MNQRDPLGSRYQSLRLARRFRHAMAHVEAQPASDAGISFQGLLDLHAAPHATASKASLGTLLLLFSLFCLMPVGGVGNVFGVALWLLSWDYGRGRTEMRLPQRVVAWRLNRRWSVWTLHTLAVGYRQAGRWMRPRWPRLQAPCWRWGWAAWIAVQAGVIFLPIPLGNTLPAFSLIALGLGWILKDGLMLCLSLLLGVLGLVYMVWLGDVVWTLLVSAWQGLFSGMM